MMSKGMSLMMFKEEFAMNMAKNEVYKSLVKYYEEIEIERDD